ncbi:MAG TPA: M13 family metallopeptidase [Steroidobacteraceae bacterium]|nr:M13 family metallopeptidase [Steroidobacteraceae bacterium]
MQAHIHHCDLHSQVLLKANYRARAGLLVMVALAVPAALAAQTTPAARTSGIDVQYIDHNVRPQDDFYRYVNGLWLNAHPIPADAVRISAASVVNDATQVQLRSIVEDVTRRGSTSSDPDERRIALLYGSFMDERTVERAGITPLKAQLTGIDSVSSLAQLAQKMGELGCIGVVVPIGDSVLNDRTHPDAYALSVYQWGLGLPGPNYYLSDAAALKEVRAAYRVHAANMLKLLGDKSASTEAQSILDLETRLARIQVTAPNGGAPRLADHIFTLARLQSFAPGMDWRHYLIGARTYGRASTLHVGEPAFFKSLGELISAVPLATWKAYLRLHLVSAYSPFLNKAFADEDFAIQEKALRGVQEMPPRWSRGLDLVNDSMGEGLGRLYVARYISADAKQRVTAMVQTFVEAFRLEIDDLAWMRPETKLKAKEKLATFRAKIGYPDHWRNYAGLRMRAGDLVGNVLRARLWEYQRNVDKLGKRVDREEWFLTPQTADAYQWLPQNEIVIGAALLQPPFFDPHADDAVNFGAIGGTIGHEMSHGFDNIGSQYDANGVLLGKPGWFTAEDQQRFDDLARALVAQYSVFEGVPGYHVNGERTLSENMADVAGAAIAYRAYHLSLGGRPAPVMDGLTGDQRFFMAWAQRRRGNYRDKELIRILESDEHSPPALRAEVPLMNLDAFVTAFGIHAGDPMYLAPGKRVHIW